MPTDPDDMAATMIANLKDKTGKALPDWLKVAKKSKLEKHGQIVRHLKADHGVTHGFANLIAHKALEAATGTPAFGNEDSVAAQYAGERLALKPIYDALMKSAKKLGKDVDVSPKKTYVSLRRTKQFALIQPSTRTRVDVGLNLKGVKPTKRLEAAGSFNAMCTHRVRVTAKKEVDSELAGWLRMAYEKA